jgi:hypothetical protein
VTMRESPGTSMNASMAFDAMVDHMATTHRLDRDKLRARICTLAATTTLALWEAFDYVLWRLAELPEAERKAIDEASQ